MEDLAAPPLGTSRLPPRRHALASVYGSLTLRNGVPIGYAQADVIGASAARIR